MDSFTGACKWAENDNCAKELELFVGYNLGKCMCDLLYKFGSVVLAMHARPVCFDMLSAFNRHNHLNKVNQHLLKHVVFDELNRQSSLCVIMYAAEAMLRFWSCD